MEPISESERLVLNYRTAEFAPFEVDGQPSATESVLQLDQSRPPGVGFHLYRMAPGSSTTPHRHTGNEQFLVIEGDLTDHDGYQYGPGDLVLLRRGTEHNSSTMNGCLLAVHIETAEENLVDGPR